MRFNNGKQNSCWNRVKSLNNATSILILANVLMAQAIFLVLVFRGGNGSSSGDLLLASSSSSTSKSNNDVLQQHLLYPLNVPPGSPPNLPSIRTKQDNVDSVRKDYGGKGDRKHLGGFTELDLHGVSPNLWTNMILNYGVKSFLDVGCGRGTSSRWFLEHGARVLCVEGSHDAVTQSHLPANLIVEHDYARGPWWPAETYDAAWSVEFLEHVGVPFHYNYVSTLRKAALIFVTSSRWGGWHHVEVHPDTWWIRKYELYGFKYDDELTQQARQWATEESANKTILAPNGEPYNPQHLFISLKVFVNPAVAALPQHQHLFPEHGCFEDFTSKDGKPFIVNRPCGTKSDKDHNGALETVLPPEYLPLQVLPEMHQRWHDAIKKGLKQPTTTKTTKAKLN
ncbi:hypothetical protein MPSEU_000261500 [Mayamaea pseudoterrestris]|nr:hypothetical protein MPSEU_000261500 [Mayamaea pseudoterrestris]